ncbi:MAG: glutaminase A [Chloroflexaceae bacterium]|nr:glutaminase A [Chloroflexaceae bacterium]
MKGHLCALQLEQLQAWVAAAIALEPGQLPTYVPLLAEAKPDRFSLCIQTVAGNSWQLGDREEQFPVMSVIKPFLLLYLLSELGKEAVLARVGLEPSLLPFNSLEQLQQDQGWPRNPMINSGAITLASLLPGDDPSSRCESLRAWLNALAQAQLTLNEAMLASVRSLPNPRNQALVRELAAQNAISAPELALDTYNQLCCLAGTTADLACLGLLLAAPLPPLRSPDCRLVKAVMLTCGLYKASARFAVEAGLPTKSGVSGAVLAVVPGQGAIACYSPPLNEEGNSRVGLWFISQIANELQLSVFE